MTWPINFSALSGGNQPLSDFDTMFNQVAAISTIPSSASGTNNISLTPLPNNPVLSAYVELCSFRFRAAGNATGPVQAQFNGLGFLNVYHGDGVTQASTGDLVGTQEYIITYSQSLNGGVGGFFLEAPAVTNVASNYYPPGGRLTFQSSIPVMTTTQATPQNLFYAPYNHPFVPIYNGGGVQMYSFTSGLSDQVGLTLALGGSASWPINTMFDVFVTLVSGVPTLCTVPWANDTTRATTLAIFGGFLTNAGVATARISASAVITLAANQGTFLGSFRTFGTTGQSSYIFGSAASGGGLADFALCNYYNQVLVNTLVSDSGAPYTYATNTCRQARASTQNAIQFVQSASERASRFAYSARTALVAAIGATASIGLGISTTVFGNFSSTGNPQGANQMAVNQDCNLSISNTGFIQVSALEQGDGANANTFNTSQQTLEGNIWL